MITVRNVLTGHVGRVTETDLELLAGVDWVRVNEATPKKPMKSKEETVVLETVNEILNEPPSEPEELTKEQLIEKLKPLGLKGLHLYSLEKLKTTYANQEH